MCRSLRQLYILLLQVQFEHLALFPRGCGDKASSSSMVMDCCVMFGSSELRESQIGSVVLAVFLFIVLAFEFHT